MEKLDFGGLGHDPRIRNDCHTLRTSDLLLHQEDTLMTRSRRSRRSRRTNPVTDFLQFVSVTVIGVFLVSAFFLGTYELFRVIDCRTATQNLERIEKCEAHPDCSVRSHELARIEGWTRLEIARCKED